MVKSDFPSDLQDKFMLRLPAGMRDRIKDVATSNNRSMNSEIVALLAEKFPEPAITESDTQAALDTLRDLMDEMDTLVKAAQPGPDFEQTRTDILLRVQDVQKRLSPK